jgi:GrpB-like predicted nucleotidyltransferase (UPF0157 family)
MQPRLAGGVIMLDIDRFVMDMGEVASQSSDLLPQMIFGRRHEFPVASIPEFIAVGCRSRDTIATGFHDVLRDPRWPALFAVEQRRIRDHAGTLALRLEHIGGTSIPGMCSKPILDIAAGRPATTSIHDYVVALEGMGYEHRGEPRAYHVHLVEEGGPLWREYLALRDYLRARGDAARQFGDVKRMLATRFSRDREGYMSAKSLRVAEILRVAVPRGSD